LAEVPLFFKAGSSDWWKEILIQNIKNDINFEARKLMGLMYLGIILMHPIFFVFQLIRRNFFNAPDLFVSDQKEGPRPRTAISATQPLLQRI
jgi:hypothetical protein